MKYNRLNMTLENMYEFKNKNDPKIRYDRIYMKHDSTKLKSTQTHMYLEAGSEQSNDSKEERKL